MTSRRITGKDAISSGIATLHRTERHKYAGWLVLNVGIKKRGSNRAHLGALSETALSFLGWGLLRFSISTCLPCRFRSLPYEWGTPWMAAFTHRFSTSLRFGTMQYTAPLLHHSFRLYRVVIPCENPPNSLSVEIFAFCISLPRTWSRVLQSCPTFCCFIFCCFVIA